MCKYFICGLIFCAYSLSIPAQDTVGSINFTGLKRTKPAYLYNFLQTQIGDSLDIDKLQADAQRLTNLEILGKATYTIESQQNIASVTFECVELFTLLPIVNFGSLTNNF